MATRKSAACIANYAPDAPDGNVKCRIGTWTYADDGTAVADDVIQMVPVPKGAQIIDILIGWTALSGGTFDVGDGTTADRFFDGLTANDIGRVSMFGGFNGSAAAAEGVCEGATKANLGYEYTAADTIDITLISGDVESGDEITMMVLYKVQGGISDET